MAIIREPKGIDFVVESHVLTDEDRQIITEHIRTRKAKLTQEEKEYNKAFTDTIQAISRLREAERSWRSVKMAY